MTSAPRALFFTSAAQRAALARQRYFEEGQLPSGFVSHAILDSWARCLRLRYNPHDAVEFNLVSNSRAQLALQRNRPLVDAWKSELSEIERTLAGTSCSAILTDASGVVIATTGRGGTQAVLTPAAHRVGVNLSEESVGTTAPGLVVKTGKPAAVLGGEHYFSGVMPMHCTAAPIHNAYGQLAGVLDISSEGIPFNFDVAGVVSLYATSIENRLLTAQSNEHLVLRLQVSPTLLETPMVGLAGIDGQGRLAWTNGVASSLFGTNVTGPREGHPSVEDLFGVSLTRLLDLPSESATPVRLANGLSVWIRAALRAPDGVTGVTIRASLHLESSASEAPPASTACTDVADGGRSTKDAPPSLRDSDKDLILRTVRAFDGNISKTAKQLRVSRGLIYRRLREANGDSG